MMNSDGRLTTAQLVTSYIHPLIHAHRQSQLTLSLPPSPTFILLQGPQGIGKTTLSRSIHAELSKPPHSLRIVILSLDDFYLPHSGLVKRAQEHPNNKLLQGRGQPGTHDLELLKTVLKGLNEGAKTQIPTFDKSLNGGAGDRSEEVVEVEGEVDIVILEGWCVGFYPLSEGRLLARYQTLSGETATAETEAEMSLAGDIVQQHSLEDLQTVNDFLKGYAKEIYPLFTGCIEVSSFLNRRARIITVTFSRWMISL